MSKYRALVWYHKEKETLFINAELDYCFCALVHRDDWNDYELVGYL